MLASLERIVAASASHFRAAELGQLSLFSGAAGMAAETIRLPEVKTDRKELLNWERELVGMYLSDHPLSPYAEMLTNTVSHNAITLAEAEHQKLVRVAGMIVASRPYRTKKDAQMGFVTLEDLHGTSSWSSSLGPGIRFGTCARRQDRPNPWQWTRPRLAQGA
jgi:DNA polymerase-3 subunit alpha